MTIAFYYNHNNGIMQLNCGAIIQTWTAQTDMAEEIAQTGFSILLFKLFIFILYRFVYYVQTIC